MIDDFLANLFKPDEPATFGQRFAQADMPGAFDGGGTMPVINPDDLLRRLNGGANFEPTYVPQDNPPGDPLAPKDQGIRMPPAMGDGAIDLSARAAPGGAGVPLPQPRPDILAMLNGEGGGAGGAGSPGPADGGAPSLVDRLFGNRPAAPAGAATPEDRTSAIGKLFGLSEKADQRIRASLASGMSGGNPAFAGGAAMKGLSGSINGGLSQEMEQQKQEKSAADQAQKQANFDRTQGDKEKTSDALRKLYGQRGEALKTNAETRANAPAKSAWNKPASERWKDAQRLIMDKKKELTRDMPIAGQARKDAMTQAEKDLEKFKKDTYKAYGIDESGNDLQGAPAPKGGRSAVPSSSKVVGDQEGKDSGLYAAGTYDDPAEPASQDEFDALEPGTYFRNPADGQIMRKKGG